MVPEAVQRAFPIRVEVEPEAYIRHLAAIHKGTNDYPETFNSVSNTCSIPLDSSEQAVWNSAMLSWQLGVKDITFYPDGAAEPTSGKNSQPGLRPRVRSARSIGPQERRLINAEETNGQTYKVRVGSPEGVSTLHVSLNHETRRPGELIEVYARMGKPGAVESGCSRQWADWLPPSCNIAAEFGEDERIKAEDTIVKQLVNIQSGYPAFFKFGDSEKAIVIQSPCDGLAKAIQQYRRNFSTDPDYNYGATVNAKGHSFVPLTGTTDSALVNEVPHRTLPSCGKCGSEAWVKIDGCLVCQGCGFSKCG